MKNLVCACVLAAGAASAQGQLAAEVLVNGIDRPVFVTHAGDGSGRLFVIEQEGGIRIIDSNGTLLPGKFMDIDGTVVGGDSGGDERGLLGLAFHPDYGTAGADGEGKFYVNYTGSGTATRIAEYQVSAFPNLADTGSARVLMTIAQPFSNHNGGWIGFGPDGYLYIATGDGGSGNDPGNRAANLGSLLGKMLRIDVDNQDAGLEYAIPAGNPWADDGDAGTRAEIWHYGLRNPWRTSIDAETGDMWIGDVGQNGWEEVNHNVGNVGGVNYGWRCREGMNPTGMPCTAPDPWTDPVHDYPLTGGNCSIMGGYVYRGCELGEAYQGKYFFGDYCAGTVWTLDPSNGYALVEEFDFGFGLSSWGVDEDGELYATDVFSGEVFRIVNPDAPDVDENGIPDACESSCPADMNGDGVVGFPDVSAFVAAFQSGSMTADFNGDGVLGFPDVSAFVAAFSAGCP